MRTDQQSSVWAGWLAVGLCAYGLLGGAISFLGWYLNIPRLADWEAGGISIQPNATIAVMVTAIAGILLRFGHYRLVLAPGILVALIGGTSLFQIVTAIDFETLNTFLMFEREWGRLGVISPGRMGTPGATSWTLLGLALCLLSISRGFTKNARGFRLAAVALAIMALTISALSITGYLYGAEVLFMLPRLTVIAFQTATFIMALSIALILLIHDAGPMRVIDAGGSAAELLRQVIPAVLIIPLFLGWVQLTGQNAGLYDRAFGVAAATVVQIVLLLGLLLWLGRTGVDTEAALARSEQRYRGLFDTINQGYCIIEVLFDDRKKAVDYRFLEVNRTFEMQAGLKDAVGKRVRELAPDLEAYWFKIFGRIATTGVPERFEQRAEQLGRWFEIDAYRFGNPENRQVAVLFNDITQRRSEESRLALFARLAEVTRTATDADELLAAVSQAVGENLRAGRCLFNEIDLDLNTGTIRSDYHPDTDSLVGVYDLSAYSANTRAEMEAGRTVVNHDSSTDPRTAGYYEKTYAPKGDRAYVAVPLMRRGKWVASLWCSDVKPRMWTDQEVRMMEAIAERAWLAVDKIRSEAALRASEEAAARLAAIVTSSEDAIVSKDLSGVIKSWNRGAENLFGYTAEEAVGRSVTMLIPDDHLDEEPMILERVRRGEVIDHYETVRRRKDGTLIDISLTVSPMRDASGRIMGASKIARDITERRKAEAELRHYREELEQRVIERTLELARANKELEAEHVHRLDIERRAVSLLKQVVTIQEDERRRIARDLHDDLGQKLTALRLMLENAKKICDEQPVCDAIEAVQSVAESLDEDIGFLARELRPPALDENALTGALKKFVRDWGRFAGVDAEFRVSGLDGERLNPDIESNLYRIVQEALNNAHKYARAKNVSVMLDRRKYDVSLIIEDDGVGFKHDEEAAEMSNQETRGLGIMGMRERAALLGGDITIESSPGSGTTIFVSVPIDTHAARGEDEN